MRSSLRGPSVARSVAVAAWSLTLFAAPASRAHAQAAVVAPLAADHHVHVFSPAVADMLRRASRDWGALTAANAIAMLDSAAIERGAVFSAAYGARDARAFIENVLALAPDVPVQIAHMAGWGGYDVATDQALGAFLQAFDAGTLDRQRIFFDLSGVVLPRSAPDSPEGTDLRLLADLRRELPDWARRLADRIRALGAGRVLFASDWPFMSAEAYRAVLREELGSSAPELEGILSSAAPYFARR